MERRKLTKEDIDKVRDIEGFPVGTDECMINISDAPHYVPCINSFIPQFIDECGNAYYEETDEYNCEPFAADISEGKKDPIYNAHSYHTKVPYKAIMRYLLHYTRPNDMVFDGFCGTGMLGLAAQMCGCDDEKLRYSMTSNQQEASWGKRKAIISDLSPAATFISSVYTTPVDIEKLDNAFDTIMDIALEKCGWMYRTKGDDLQRSFIETEKKIEYTVWSDVFICPNCGAEVVFWDSAVDKNTGSVASEFCCKNCSAKMTKKNASRMMISKYDDKIGSIISTVVRVRLNQPFRVRGN